MLPSPPGGVHRRPQAVAKSGVSSALSPPTGDCLDEPSTPSLDFPAAITAEITPIFGFGGATVDGVELPVWPQLLTSSARY